jgi:hypothetical protein
MLDAQTLGGGSQFPMPIQSHSLSNGGNLANFRSQVSFTSASREPSWFSVSPFIFEFFSASVPVPASSSLLSSLKRKAFGETGRAERISKSLAAVNAAQPTHLSPSEWKQVAEADIEDQY